MTDLDDALSTLRTAFPDDPGPAADPFVLKDRFDLALWYGRHYTDGDFDALIRSWTPRILRLLISRVLQYEDRIPLRFDEAGWLGWPEHQRAAVLDVLFAWWRTTLAGYPAPLPVGEVLMCVTKMTGDVRPLLATWSAIGGVPAARHLADFMIHLVSWDDCPAGFEPEVVNEHIAGWLRREGVDVLFALPEGAELTAAVEMMTERQHTWERWLDL